MRRREEKLLQQFQRLKQEGRDASDRSAWKGWDDKKLGCYDIDTDDKLCCFLPPETCGNKHERC